MSAVISIINATYERLETSPFVGILVFMSSWNYVRTWVEHEKSFISSGQDVLYRIVPSLKAFRYASRAPNCKYFVINQFKHFWCSIKTDLLSTHNICFDWEIKWSIISHINCIAARCLINVVYLTGMYLTLHVLNDVANALNQHKHRKLRHNR